jgi:membrane associated rhomboid family serine protease
MRTAVGYSFRGETPVVYVLLSIMGIVFLIDFYSHGVLTLALAWPVTFLWLKSLHLWLALTFPFVHFSDFNSLLTDAILLFFIGRSVEQAWGPGRFLFFFFASGMLAGVIVLILTAINPSMNGGIFIGMVGSFLAISIAFASMSPNSTILFFFVLPLPAWTVAVIGVAIELFFRNGLYGGPIPASIAIVGVGLFAFAFTRGRFSLSRAFSYKGPSLRERIERWQQRRRLRELQRRVTRVNRPVDLFKDKK